MSNESYAIRINNAWDEPQDFPEPTAEQWTGGVVVVMTACMSGGDKSLQMRERYLMDAAQGNDLVGAGYARFETEREERIAKAEGHKRPNRSVKSKAPKAAKAKAEKAAPAESSEEADGGEG